MLGDQVYADEVSPETLAFIKKRRDVRKPPGEEIADFEEYTRLYRESWSDPAIRWLLSTVSCSMVVDDHDINDDWNISAAWVEEMRREEWWAERECAGIASYWLYQFIGNLSPELLRESELLAAGPQGRRRLGGAARVRRERPRSPRRRALELLPRPRPYPAARRRLALRAGARRGPALDARRRGVGVARATPPGRLRPPADRDLGSRSCSRPAFITSSAGARRSAPAPGASAGRDWVRSCGGRSTSITGPRSASRSSGWRSCSSAPAPAVSGRRPHRSRCSRVTFTTPTSPRSPSRARRRSESSVWQAVCSPFRNALDERERTRDRGSATRARGCSPGAPSRGSPGSRASRSAGGWSRGRSTTTRSRR